MNVNQIVSGGIEMINKKKENLRQQFKELYKKGQKLLTKTKNS